MTYLKEALLIIKNMTGEELEMTQVFIELCLELRAASAAKEIPGIHEYAVKVAYKSAKAMVDKRKAKEKKVKTVAPKAKRNYKKVWDPASALEKMGANSGGNERGPTKSPPVKRGAWGKVYDALLQTTGKIGAHELSEFLNLDVKVVSTTLSGQFKRGFKGLAREPSKHITSSGQEVAQYVYWLDGGPK